MIILDTNVISELMRPAPDERVKQWMGNQKSIRLGVSTITIAEIQRGLLRLPDGKRKTSLQDSFQNFMKGAFCGRIFTFDDNAAYAFGELAAKTENAGLNSDVVDLMIAAICKSLNAAIATRNVRDFKGCDMTIINPWD